MLMVKFFVTKRQNLFLKGLSRPARLPKMESAGTADKASLAALPQVADKEGLTAVILLGAGGIAYTAGAIVYALRRPDPVPHIFGYHELFHALTIVAVACQYVAIAFYVVKVG